MTEPGNWRSALGHAVADVLQESLQTISPEAWGRVEPEALASMLYDATFRKGLQRNYGLDFRQPAILSAIRSACQWAQKEALDRLDR